VVPCVGAGNSAPAIVLTEKKYAPGLIANLNAFVLDFLVRQNISGSNLNFFILKQIPVFSPSRYSQQCPWDQARELGSAWIEPRVLELTYTAWDLEGFAVSCGYNGPPYRWDAERRFLLRSELDAAYFHLYKIDREDVDYILEAFPIVRSKDEGQYAEYRTKRVILEIYDEMQRAMDAGEPYQTILQPPPADPSLAHLPRIGMKA